MAGLSGAWSGGAGRPGGQSVPPQTNGLGGTTFADRWSGLPPAAINLSSNASFSPSSGVEVGGSFGLSGLLTVAVLLAGLVALDRYVLDVPGVGGGK
ncbi:MAG: hypothetical protein AB7G36_18860 [Candidatus Nanopelagicales bacterium]